jgi:hypothetical protein
MSRYINFVTLQSGNVKRSLPSNISDIAKQKCTDLITAGMLNKGGKIPITHFDGYFLQLNSLPNESILFGSVFYGEFPITTFAVCPNSKHSQRLWAMLHDNAVGAVTKVDSPPSAPWLAAYGHPSALTCGDLDWVTWIAGLEECLAWAWMDYGR